MPTKTEYYREQDLRYLWHPYSRYSAIQEGAFPIIRRGDGVYLIDTDGNRYLDAISSWWSCSLGHNHPRLVSAIRKQVSSLQHSILGNLSHERAIELAGAIVHLLGKEQRRVFFSSDGASAVESALKIAVQYWYNRGQPEKNKFVSLEGSYHGDTLGAVSVGYLRNFHQPFKPLLFPVYRAVSPCCGLCKWHKKTNSCALQCFDSMQHIIKRHAKEIAAVIIEPLCQASGGMRIYSPAYLKKLSELCRKKKVLLICDEIATGFGRTGRMFAFEHARINPDIVCLGKALSAGYLPISATVVKESIYRTFKDKPVDHTFYHGHTFGGNPIAAAVALEALRIYQEEDIVARSASTGKLLAKALKKFTNLPSVKNVRFLGMIGVVELANTADRSGASLAQEVQNILLKKHILIRPLGNVVYVMPPLITPETVLNKLVSELYEAIGKII